MTSQQSSAIFLALLATVVAESGSGDVSTMLADLVRSFSKSCDEAAGYARPDDDGECESGGLMGNAILSIGGALLTVTLFRCMGTSNLAAISAGVAVAAIISSIVSAIMLG